MIQLDIILSTIFKTTDLNDSIMENEYFGPLVSVCVYPDDKRLL